MYNQHLWILGCVQNSEKYLSQVFANLQGCQSLFAGSTILVLENDSRDCTRSWLRSFGRTHGGVKAQSFQGLNDQIPVKTVRLAALRNAGIDWLHALGALRSPNDLVMILDFDEVNADPWDFSQLEQVVSRSWLVIKQAQFFLISLALITISRLRHSELCPHDVWWQVYQMHIKNPHWSDSKCLDAGYFPWQLNLSPRQEPFMVDSAFGGLGLYKASWLQRAQAPYCGETVRLLCVEDEGSRLLRWQVCEHVNFHAGLRSAGASLWIYPAWINWNTQTVVDRGGLRPNPSSWKYLSF